MYFVRFDFCDWWAETRRNWLIGFFLKTVRFTGFDFCEGGTPVLAHLICSIKYEIVVKQKLFEMFMQKRFKSFMFCWPCISYIHLKKTNLMHNSFSVYQTLYTYMFRAHLQPIIRRYTVWIQQSVLIVFDEIY